MSKKYFCLPNIPTNIIYVWRLRNVIKNLHAYLYAYNIIFMGDNTSHKYLFIIYSLQSEQAHFYSVRKFQRDMECEDYFLYQRVMTKLFVTPNCLKVVLVFSVKQILISVFWKQYVFGNMVSIINSDIKLLIGH